MTRLEHLLTIMAEEAGEVTQEACKAGRFGVYDSRPVERGGDGENNIQHLIREFADQWAVMEMIMEELQVTVPPDLWAGFKKAKKQRVEVLLKYSKECGTLEAQ